MTRFPKLAPVVFGLGLFVANNAGVFSGWMSTPDGHVPLMHADAVDNAIYESWLRSSEERVLHPNFQAPWLTKPAIFSPLLLLIARVSSLAGISLNWGWFLAHLGLYVLGAYAVFAALWVFMKTPRERWMALAALMLVVPLPSLLMLPSAVLPLERFGIPPQPGLGAFVWRTSDGLLHGIGGSILVTYGTVATVAAFACLAAYMETGRRRYLIGSGASALLCGIVHPYEPYLIVGAGGLALLIWRWPHWRRAIPPVAALGVSGALGIAPLALLALTTPWVRDAAGLTRWPAPNPIMLLAFLGVPSIAAVALLLARPKMASPSDLLLQCWFVGTLVGVYVPFLPWTKHFLDGFHIAAAMLLVRLLMQSPWVARTWAKHRRVATAGVGATLILSLTAYGMYYWQAWSDGPRPEPQRLFRSVVPEADVAARDWLADNAQFTDLVLAPVKRATWFSSVPMHSVAGNYLFSITFEEQSRQSDDFFAGRMDSAAANRLLTGYGVRWVVVPPDSPARAHLGDAKERARFGPWTILEIEGNTTVPYPGRPR